MFISCSILRHRCFLLHSWGLVARAQQILQTCLGEVDQVVAAGKANRLDRIARRLSMEGSGIRAAAQAFISSQDAKLEDHLVLYIALMEYSLIPFVERRIEKVHATVQHVGQGSFGVSVEQLCAAMRERRSLDLVKRSSELHEICVDRCHQRSRVDQVLSIRLLKATLASKPFKEKVRRSLIHS